MEVLSISNKGKDLFINEQIKANRVLVIGPNGEQLGEKTKEDALTLALYAGFDLVMINDEVKPPVCKLLDYKKFKYEKKKKQKEARKKQKEINLETKEFRLSAKIAEHDLQTKVRNVLKYLKKGHKIKLTIRFKGREMVHTDIGKEVLLDFAKRLEELSEIEQQPKLDGRIMTMFLIPKRK
jgi:translation initiation factor IF-3